MEKHFYYCASILPEAHPCTPEKLHEIFKSRAVMANCEAIRKIAESLPDNPTKEQWAAYKKAIAPYKCGDRQRGIPSLPGICFHAAFPHGKRNNEDAQLSGLVTLDLDGIPEPREVFGTFREKAKELGLVFAYVSPSGKGLKLVFVIPEETHSLAEAQQILISKLHLEEYADTATTDAARLSFAAPEDYILHNDEEELFADHPLPVGFTTPEEVTEAEQIDSSKESHAPLPKNIAAEKTYKGLTYQAIIDRLAVKLCGATTPEEGQRQTKLLKALRCLRTICDDDYDLMLQIMPQWDPDTAKSRAALKYVLNHQQYDRDYQTMESIVAELKAEEAQQEGKQSLWTLPLPPCDLPPLFKEFAKVTPKELQPSVLFSLLPLVGIYGSMLKVNIAPKGRERTYLTPSFITCIVAPPASGKGMISLIYKRIMAKLKERDERNRALYNEWQQNRNKESYKGHEPKMPIFDQPERLSMTSITKQMSNAAGRHILIFTPEIDTLKTSNGSGAWDDLTTVIRKSTDNDEIGQMYMSSESFSCKVKTFLNMLIEAQPSTMRAFFTQKNVNNGLVDRVNFVELPDNTGMEEVFMRQMSEKDRKTVDDILDHLFNIGNVVEEEERDEDGVIIKPAKVERVEVQLPRTLKAMDAFTERHRNHYNESQTNPAEDHFRRRARQTGIKAALIAYGTSGMHETTKVVKFAEYMAEFDYQMHMYLFAKQWNKQYHEDKKVQAECEQSAAANEINIFAELPDEFTSQLLLNIETRYGIPDKNPRRKINNWVDNGWAKDTKRMQGRFKIFCKNKDKKAV